MSEFSEAIKQRYLKQKSSDTQERINKQRVKAKILSLCEEYLEDADDVLTFECGKNELGYALEAINEEPLISRYSFSQISEYLFEVSMVELEF